MSSKLESFDLEIIKLFNKGFKNKDIAEKLGLSKGSVRYRLRKYNLKSNFRNPIEILEDGTKAKCKKCGDIKYLIEFQYGRKGTEKEYRFSYCNDCRNKQTYLNLNSSVDKFLADRFNRLRIRARKENVPLDLTKEQFISQYKNQNGLCFYTDEKLVCEVGSNKHEHSLSVDRFDPRRGYVSENIVFCTYRINTCKSNLIPEILQKYMPELFYRFKIKQFCDQIKSDGGVILYLDFNDSQIDKRAKNHNGGFDAATNPPTIYVPTYKYIIEQPFERLSALEILCTLAHEYGHYQSYYDGYWTDDLKNWRAISKDAVIEEEERAWNNGCKILQSYFLNGTTFPITEYLRIQRDSLNSYKEPRCRRL